MLKIIILVSFGGALGAPTRFLINLFFKNFIIYNFPFGTLLINVIGSFFIGLLAKLIQNNVVHNEIFFKYFLIIGFLGSFTTFSAFSLESIEILNSGNYIKAFIYIGTTLLLNILAVYIGLNLLNNFH